jgi:hypothetical protein
MSGEVREPRIGCAGRSGPLDARQRIQLLRFHMTGISARLGAFGTIPRSQSEKMRG